jgi:hypothetical protein
MCGNSPSRFPCAKDPPSRYAVRFERRDIPSGRGWLNLRHGFWKGRSSIFSTAPSGNTPSMTNLHSAISSFRARAATMILRTRRPSRQILEFQVRTGGFVGPVSARHFPISVSACPRPVRYVTETGLRSRFRGLALNRRHARTPPRGMPRPSCRAGTDSWCVRRWPSFARRALPRP